MTIEESVFSALSGDADVGPLVAEGVSPERYRIFPAIAKDDAALPYIVYTIIFGEHLATLGPGRRRSALKHARVQLDVVARSYAAARSLADHVYDALDANMSVGSMEERSLYATDTELHQLSLDFSIWE